MGSPRARTADTVETNTHISVQSPISPSFRAVVLGRQLFVQVVAKLRDAYRISMSVDECSALHRGPSLPDRVHPYRKTCRAGGRVAVTYPSLPR